MERKIFYNLIHSEKTRQEKSSLFNKLKSLPKKAFSKETNDLIVLLEMIDSSKKEINKQNVKTYLSFYKGFNPRKYFFEVNKEKIDLEIAVDLFVKEKIFKENERILEKALQDYKNTGDETLIQNIEFQSSETKDLIIDSKSFIDKTLTKFRNIKEGKDKDAISLSPSFLRLDVVTHGFEKGELILIAARPSVGKTAFALSLMNHFSKKNRVMFVSYEMDVEELGERMFYAKAGVYRDQIKHKERFTEEIYERLENAGEEISKQSFKTIDAPPLDFVSLREVIRKEAKDNGLDILIVDHLGLIRAFDKTDKYDPYLTTSQISAHMKLLAKELNIVIILLQQVNRKMSQGNRKNAQYIPLELTDLRDSGTLEQDANKVLLIWNKEAENEEEEKTALNGNQKIIVYLAKNRGGRAGHKFQFHFNKNLQRITEDSWLTAPDGWKDEFGDEDE